MARIAVEYPFTDIRQALLKKRYDTDMVQQEADASVYDVIVVRNQNALNTSNIKGSLVETRGRSVNEVVREVEERLRRTGKIPGAAKAERSKPSGGSFTSGLLTGAMVGAAAALFMAPKSGKELQSLVTEKMPSGNSEGSRKFGQIKEKAVQVAGQVKDKDRDSKEQT